MPFNIKIDGLAEVLNVLEKTPGLEYIAADISVGILKLHNSLTLEVERNYFTPYSLDNVFLGRFTERQSGNVLSAGISYKQKAVPLDLYPHKQSGFFEVRNAIPFKRENRDGSSSIGYIPQNRARSVRSTISRKGSSGNIFYKRTKYKKFLANGKIFARTTERTWDELPFLENGRITGGNRAPIDRLYGPTVAELASNIFNSRTSNKFDEDISNMLDKAIQGFAKYYA